MPDVKENTKPQTPEVKKVKVSVKPNINLNTILVFAAGTATGIVLTILVQGVMGSGESVTVSPEAAAE